MTVLLIVIVIMAVIGTPLFTAMGGLSIVNFLKESMLLVVPQEISGLSSMALLHSIPLFTFAGYILAESKASMRLVRFSRALLGWMPGGMAIVTLIVCAAFTAFTGGSGVTIVAIGGLLLPALLQEHYEEDFSLGLITTSGSLGLLFPPSLPIILFGVMASVSVDQMFIAGMLPGILMILILSIYCVFRTRKFNFVRVKFSWSEVGKALWDIKWELPLPFLLVGGIQFGYITISDSAAFTVLYVLIVEMFCTRDIKFKDLPRIMKNSMTLVGAILIILAVSLASSNYIVYKDIPHKIFDAIKGIITNKVMFLLMLNLFLIVVGCIMDIFSALVVVIPLILPLAEAYNVDLVHLGIVFLLNLEMGYITPPVGMNLFISSIRFDKPILQICKSVLPYIAISFVTLMLVTYIPSLSLWYMTPPAVEGKWVHTDENGRTVQFSLKANDVMYYKAYDSDDFLAQFNDPELGSWKFDKKNLHLFTNEGEATFKYEIYRRGARLLVVDERGGRKMLRNEINPPLDARAGRLTTLWTDESGNSFDFYLNGRVGYSVEGDIQEARYDVTSNKIIIYPDDQDEQKIVYKYKLINKNSAKKLQLTRQNKKFLLNCQKTEKDL